MGICVKGKYSYKFLNVPDIEAINSLYINNCLLHLKKEKLKNSYNLIDDNTVHGELAVDKLLKGDKLISSLAIFIPAYKEMSHFETYLTNNDLSEYLNC